jgi:hypothetical protein
MRYSKLYILSQARKTMNYDIISCKNIKIHAIQSVHTEAFMAYSYMYKFYIVQCTYVHTH